MVARKCHRWDQKPGGNICRDCGLHMFFTESRTGALLGGRQYFLYRSQILAEGPAWNVKVPSCPPMQRVTTG